MSKIYGFFRKIILPIDKIDKLLPKKGKILDIGCGYGITSAYFAQNKNRKVLGLELNKKRVQIAKINYSNIKNLSFKTADLINTKEKNFDCIVAIDLLHHISNLQKIKFIKDVEKKLTKNGTLVIKDIGKKPFLKYLWNYLHDLIMVKFDKLYFYSSEQFESLMIKNNFKIIKKGEFKNFFYPHIFYVCQKNS